MSSREIGDMTPELQEKFHLFRTQMQIAGLPFILTCTARTVAEQIALYAQGREPLEITNTLRNLAYLAPITAAANRRKVTWTLNSKHLIDLDDNIPGNDKARAFDIALMIGRKPHWDIKADVNDDDIDDYRHAGEIGESLGLKWGGRFRSPDWVHFEI